MAVSDNLPPVGPSGAIARVFQNNHLTPLLAILAIILGVLSVVVTPKEEEPQIDVTMADIMVAMPGASTREVESAIATPAEQVMSEIKGVKHVYSVSRQGQAVITVQFEVGIARQDALVRLYNQVYSNQDWLPQNLGASQPVIKPRGIDDVPVMTLTLYDPTGTHSGEELTRLAPAFAGAWGGPAHSGRGLFAGIPGGDPENAAFRQQVGIAGGGGYARAHTHGANPAGADRNGPLPGNRGRSG